MKSYTFEESFVQTLVSFLDGLYTILKVFPVINPGYAQQIATVLFQIKEITDKQNTEVPPSQ